MTRHCKPKRSLFARAPRLRLPRPCLPLLRTLFGCTADGRILWIKVGYMTRNLPDDHGY